jgi:hypothetical protein
MIESSLHRSESVSLPPIRPFGRVVRSVAAYGVVTALMMVSPLLVFVPAALFHCAMKNGRKAVYVAASIAVLLVGFYFAQVASVSAGSARNMAYASFAFLVLSVVVPSLAAIPLVERNEKFGNVVAFTVAGAAIGLIVLEIVMRNVAGFSPYALYVALAQENGASFIRNVTSSADADVVRTMEKAQRFGLAVLPAALLMESAMKFVLSLMMFGRVAASRLAETQRTYLFRNFALPDFLLFGFVFGGLTPLTSGTLQKIAANVLAVVLFLYMLQGLAIVRFMLVRAGAGVFGNVLAFSLLAMLAIAGIGLLAITMAGLFDPFFDFRHLKRKDDLHEGHTD